jgi:hypothetical protein
MLLEELSSISQPQTISQNLKTHFGPIPAAPTAKEIILLIWRFNPALMKDILTQNVMMENTAKIPYAEYYWLSPGSQ